jgi:glycosyltransferase involved in cell wall biosynthesis
MLSTADWSAPLQTNKQHIARRLAARGVDVVYFDSLGLRRPSARIADIRRIARRFDRTDRARSSRATPDHVRTISPQVLPFHGVAGIRWLNRHSLRRQMTALLDDPSVADAALYSFSPVTYGTEALFRTTLYHSVDFLHGIPRIPSRFVQQAEISLVGSATHIAASSRPVHEHLSRLTRRTVHYWPNVGDTKLYRNAWGERRPRALFAGNLTPDKVDFNILRNLLEAGVQLQVAGPVGIDGTSPGATSVLGHQNTTYHGILSQNALAKLAGTCTVGVIPYHINEYTLGVFPMKVVEYLSAGLAVVSTVLPSLSDEHLVDLLQVSTNGAFVDECLMHLPVPAESRQRERADQVAHRSWDRRVDTIVELLESGDGTGRWSSGASFLN